MASTQRLGSLATGLFLFFLCLCCLTTQGSSSNSCEDSNSQAVHSLLCTLPLNVNVTRKEFAVFFAPDDGTEVSLVDCRWPGEGFFCFKRKGVDCLQPVSDQVNITVPGSVACKTGQYRVKIFDTSHVGKATCRPFSQPVGQVDRVTQAINKDLTPPINEDTNSSAMILGVSVAAAVGMLVIAVVLFIKRKKVGHWLKKKTSRKRPEKAKTAQDTSLLSKTTPDPSPV